MNQNVIAFWHPLNPPSLYQAGEVHGELHFIRTAGAGTVVRAAFPRPRRPPHTSADAPADDGPCHRHRDALPLLRDVGHLTPPPSLSARLPRYESPSLPVLVDLYHLYPLLYCVHTVNALSYILITNSHAACLSDRCLRLARVQREGRQVIDK